MKKLFAILAMICMVAISAPAMAIDMDEDGEQFQGGINIYIENGAFAIGEDLAAGSANIVAGQASMQYQENDTDINFCNKEEVYMQEQDNYYYNGYDYDYFRGESPMEGTYELKGQNQTWHSEIRFNTGYGMAEMIQHGEQNGMSATFTQTPQLDLNGIANQAEYFFDGGPQKDID